MQKTAWQIAVVGAGPVGLATALHAAQLLPGAQITVFDARPADRDVSADPRTLALSQGSVQFLQQLQAWPAAVAEPILQVQVSQMPPTLSTAFGEPLVRLEAAELGVPQLGAVLSYGALVAPLQQAWERAVAAQPGRLHLRLGTPVSALKAVPGGVELDAGIAETFDLAVVAEGGVFAEKGSAEKGSAEKGSAEKGSAEKGSPEKAGADKLPGVARAAGWRRPLVADYHQTAWVGSVTLDGATRGLAIERFTRHGPAALLPLPADAQGRARAALVWCVASGDDPVRELTDAQRLAVLRTLFPPAAGRLVDITPLKPFALGLHAERTLVSGRVVRIGNAAQTLHPVAGQGLNLGLRDAHELVAVLRWADDLDAALKRADWARAADRWSMIAATDFLARSFTWKLPGAATARGLGLAALQAMPPVRHWLARRMMFGSR